LLFVVTVTFFVVLVFNFFAFRHEASTAPLLSTFYAALCLFGATYLPLPPQGTAPSSLISALGVLSLAVTIFAVISTLFGIVLASFANFRAGRIRGALVIIGNGQTAMGVLRRAEERLSAQSADGRRSAVVLVTDAEVPRTTSAALGALNVVRSSLSREGLTRPAERVIKFARDIIVATDDDALNRQLTRSLGKNVTGTSVRIVGIISSPRYADELRPPVLDGFLPPTDYTSPHENVAQFIAAIVDAISLVAFADRQSALVVQIEDIDGVEGDLVWAVELALTRLSRARASIRDTTRPRIRVQVLDAHTRRSDPPDGIAIHLLVGGDTAEVAASLLAAARHHNASKFNESDRSSRITIGVTDARLFPDDIDRELSGPTLISDVCVLDPSDWPNNFDASTGVTLALDKDAVGLDDGLVLDTLESCWGRSYHNAHGFMYQAMDPWNYHSHNRNEQSSIAAVRTMMEQLAVHGYALYRTDSEPQHVLPSGTEVEEIARAEHEAWRQRTWTDPETGQVLRAPQKLKYGIVSDNPADRPYTDLEEATRAYNERVPVEIYPAVAASMGYEIRRKAEAQSQNEASISGESRADISL
jgi:hypothetical protein